MALPLLLLTKSKKDKNNIILIIFYIAASLVILTENLQAIDQVALFYAFTTILLAKIAYDGLKQHNFKYTNSFKYLTPAFLILALTQKDDFMGLFFSIGGATNLIWPLAIIFILRQYRKNIIDYKRLFIDLITIISLFTIAIASLVFFNKFLFQICNLIATFIILLIYEIKYRHNKKTLASFTTILSAIPLIYLSSFYIESTAKAITVDHKKHVIHLYKDSATHYIKKLANDADNRILFFSEFTPYRYPLINYLNRDNLRKFYVSNIMNIKPNQNSDKYFTYGYLLEDTLSTLEDDNTKLLVLKNDILRETKDYCAIGILEQYLRIPQFRKIFIQNFSFENKILIFKKDGKIVRNFSFYRRNSY